MKKKPVAGGYARKSARARLQKPHAIYKSQAKALDYKGVRPSVIVRFSPR